jgi:hypothetical protein
MTALPPQLTNEFEEARQHALRLRRRIQNTESTSANSDPVVLLVLHSAVEIWDQLLSIALDSFPTGVEVRFSDFVPETHPLQRLRQWMLEAEGQTGHDDASTFESTGNIVSALIQSIPVFERILRFRADSAEQPLSSTGATNAVHSAAARASELERLISRHAPQRELLIAEKDAEKARASAQAAELSAAMAAQKALSGEFGTLSKRETEIADNFRKLVVATVAILIGASATASIFGSNKLDDLVPHLAISVPLLILAGYFAREAAHHRRFGRWARVLQVQLQTIEAYVAPLNAEDRSRLLTEFGSRVLGPLPEAAGGEDDGDLTTALSIIERLAARPPKA